MFHRGRREHLVDRNRLHEELRALHHNAFVLVLSCVSQQGALVVEHQRFGAVGTSHFNVDALTSVVTRKALLQPEGITTLSTTVALSWQADIALGWRLQIGYVCGDRVGVIQQPVQGHGSSVGEHNP